MLKRITLGLVRSLPIAVLLLSSACSDDQQHAPPVGVAEETQTSTLPEESSALTLLASELRFAGEYDMRLRPAPGGAKLFDAAGVELARYHLREDGSVRVRDAADIRLGRVKGEPDKLKLTGPDGAPLIAILQLQDDGDWKLEDANEVLQVRIGQREYGHKLQRASGQQFGKARMRGSRTVFEDADGVERFSVDRAISTAAFACLALDSLELPMRVALLLRVQHDHGE